MTKAEAIIRHSLLKEKKMLGYKFRRQKVVGSFIVDFYCSELRLGIEIDGGYHNTQKVYDEVRDETIKKLGVMIIRITNDEVLNDLGNVQRDIKSVIWEREQVVK